ncbi:DUF924 family protein [Stappia indica]|uniref:DUF924 family protein n=1 Tax=Stappia indica TaxID=538381 RepID=UPI001CD27AD8|nr:DUF924 family protein [Stappia indica]MCA1299493.1 DUF924 domain-containing protein [Stappia indica]
MTVRSAPEILDFWFSDAVEQAWFSRSEAVDREIAERFAATYEAARAGALDGWKGAADSALALTISLDQFPRNLFRGSARAFESDSLALASAKHGLAQGYDQAVGDRQRQFFYLPLMHSEDLDDQTRCVALYRDLGDEHALGFAIEHRDIIDRFGRFPHRNKALGRRNTEAEAAFLEHHSGF